MYIVIYIVKTEIIAQWDKGESLSREVVAGPNTYSTCHPDYGTSYLPFTTILRLFFELAIVVIFIQDAVESIRPSTSGRVQLLPRESANDAF